jgi:hypothetical protein
MAMAHGHHGHVSKKWRIGSIQFTESGELTLLWCFSVLLLQHHGENPIDTILEITGR